MSTSYKDIIQESLQLFRKGLVSSVPLRHFSKHRDEAKIREAVQQECVKAFTRFTRNLNSSKVDMTRKGDLVKEFCSELGKVTKEYVTNYQSSKEESESFLRNRMEVCGEDFQSSINAKLLIDPEMDLKTVENFFEVNSDLAKTTAMEITVEHNAISEVGIERPLQEDSGPIVMTTDSALAPSEMPQDTSLENGIKPEEMSLRIDVVASMQPEPNENNDSGDEIQIIGEVRKAPWYPDSGENGIDRNSEIGIKVLHHADLDIVVSPPTLKRLKQKKETVSSNGENYNPLNIPDTNGNFSLLKVIIQGLSYVLIGKVLDSGADVNIKSKDTFEINAAHAVIMSLLFKLRSPTHALTVLNLLVDKGFHLINEKSRNGLSPLLLAMKYADLNEEILNWFFDQGANFNAVDDKLGNSVLLNAISEGQPAEIICKIIDFGGDPKYVNQLKWNALHTSAGFANESALEFFIDIDKLDVNEGDRDGDTPLHLLFLQEKLEHRYELCLEILLKKGADFARKNEKGLVPLVSWMGFGRGNPFPTLLKMKDSLPITLEMASATLTAIVRDIEKMQKILSSSSSSPPNEFVRFILILIEDMQAKLLWKGGNQWQKFNTDKVAGEIFGMTSRDHGQQSQLSTKLSGVSLTVETILACTLTGKNYQGFVQLCRLVEGLEGSGGPERQNLI